MAQPNIHRGVNGRVIFAGAVSGNTADMAPGSASANISAERWSVNVSTEEVPAIGFEDYRNSNIYDDGDFAVMSAAIQISGYWDALNNPHSSPPGIVTGARIGGVSLYLNRVTALRWTFNAIRIYACQVDTEIKSRVNLAFSAKSGGQFTYPGTI